MSEAESDSEQSDHDSESAMEAETKEVIQSPPQELKGFHRLRCF